jgi:hypothetical protein
MKLVDELNCNYDYLMLCLILCLVKCFSEFLNFYFKLFFMILNGFSVLIFKKLKKYILLYFEIKNITAEITTNTI